MKWLLGGGAAAVALAGAALGAGAPPGLPSGLESWGYQLQDLDVDELTASRFPLLVIDYAVHGDERSELTAQQVRKIREEGPCGPRLVLAYLSIGEAESYRYYFDPTWLGPDLQPAPGAPSWLGPTNPHWEGNYKVRYWQRGWRSVLMGSRSGPDRGYLDRIVDAGFDGVWLDIVDGYEYWGPEAVGGNGERPRAARDMINLVRRIDRYARRTRGMRDFLVVPQNGAGIFTEEAHSWASDPAREAGRQRRRYLRVVDAIGAEDSFFFGPRDQNNPWRPQRYTLDLLARFHAAGKPVLAIDYLTRRAKIDRFWKEVRERGWVPHVSRRDLARLSVPTGHPPDC